MNAKIRNAILKAAAQVEWAHEQDSTVLLHGVADSLRQAAKRCAPDARPYRTQAAEIAKSITDLQHVEGLPTVFHDAVNQAAELLSRVCVELETAPARMGFDEALAARARVFGYVTQGNQHVDLA